MSRESKKRELQTRRAIRTRAKLKSAGNRLRLSVFRSAKHIYVQIIDDKKGSTLVNANDKELKLKDHENKKLLAFKVGELVGNKCKDKKISEVVFDKGSYKYHGRVKEVAEGARSVGLKF